MNNVRNFSENSTNFLVLISSILFSFYVILSIIKEDTFFYLDISVLSSLLLFVIFFLIFVIYFISIRDKIYLNNKINQKLSISLKISLIFFLFLPISFLILSETEGFLNIGLIIFFIILDFTQYDHYLYLYLKENNKVFIRIMIFSTFMLLFLLTFDIIFFLLSFSAFIDIIVKVIRLFIYNLRQIFKNFFNKIVYFLSNLLRWILTLIIQVLLLFYLIIVHYLRYFQIVLVLMKSIWENKIKSLKWGYLIIYLIEVAFLVVFRLYDINFLIIFLIMTVLLIIIFSKEITILFSNLCIFFISLVKSLINLILHEKKKMFIALMWILTGISFILAYLSVILGLFYTGVAFLFMGIIFIHLAKIEEVQKFYKELYTGVVRNLVKILHDFKFLIQILIKKLYYLIIHELLYRLLQIINVLMLIFGFYLIFSSIFDPTGNLSKILLEINIIALFPDLNAIFEFLFGFSLLVISIVLFITTVQNKKKLVR